MGTYGRQILIENSWRKQASDGQMAAILMSETDDVPRLKEEAVEVWG